VNLHDDRATSHIRLRILRDGLEGWDDSIHDVLDFEERNDFLEFVIGDAADFRFNIIDVLDIVAKKRFKVFLPHGESKLLNFGDEFVPDSPCKLIGDNVEVGLQRSRRLHLGELDDRIDEIDLVGLLFIFCEDLDYL
jgi:hypothetical protein